MAKQPEITEKPKQLYHATWYTDDSRLLTTGKNIEASSLIEVAQLLNEEGIEAIYICNKSLMPNG